MATETLSQAAAPKQPTETAGSAEAGRKPVKSYHRGNLALAEKFETYLGARGFSPHTRRAYRHAVTDFCDFIRAESVAEVSHTTVREWIAYLCSRGCSPQTISREVYALRSFFDFLGRAGVVELSPLRLIRNRRLPKRLPRFVTEQAIGRLLAAPSKPRDQAILEVIYATGCRVAELASIRLENLDFGDGTVGAIKIMGKGGKEAMVYFGKPAARAIKKSLGRRRNGYLFIADGHSPDPERPLTSRMIRSIINAVAHRAGLGHLNPHALRHSFGTHLVDHGADVMYVKELLRHESVRTTQIYLHASIAGLRAVYRRCHPRA